jgi:phosphotransferase system enzyme I (PtsI)
MTCEAARESGIWVGVCGEAAADPALIPRLLELGVTELSMSAPSIPRAKKLVSEL